MGKHYFNVGFGFMGWMPDTREYQLFPTLDEYYEAFDEANEPYSEIVYID